LQLKVGIHELDVSISGNCLGEKKTTNAKMKSRLG